VTMTPIYPAHCVPCLAKRECQSLPHSNNCEQLRHTDDDELDREDKIRLAAIDRNEQARIDEMRGVE
jgi:hypothetical protein